MLIERRISATFKDLPGGQLLGPTFDYTHRLLDPALAEGGDVRRRPQRREPRRRRRCRASPTCSAGEGLIEPDEADAERCRRATSRASRCASRSTATCGCRRWRAATRASCWRSAIRPSAATPAPIPSSARSASARSRSSSTSPELGFAVRARRDHASPSARWSTSSRARPSEPPQFTRGYGLVFGQAERKAMAMALCRPGAARARARRGHRRPGAGRGIRHLALRQRRRRPASSST